jgi:hypothetical protein
MPTGAIGILWHRSESIRGPNDMRHAGLRWTIPRRPTRICRPATSRTIQGTPHAAATTVPEYVPLPAQAPNRPLSTVSSGPAVLNRHLVNLCPDYPWERQGRERPFVAPLVVTATTGPAVDLSASTEMPPRLLGCPEQAKSERRQNQTPTDTRRNQTSVGSSGRVSEIEDTRRR